MKFYRNCVDSQGNQAQRELGGTLDTEKPQYDIYEIIPFIPKKFEDDVFNLKIRVGEENFYQGLTIEASLAEMIEICPHGNRKRKETYDSLVAFLKDQLDINLIITSTRNGYITDTAW